jgi:hypothetical protein
MQFFVKFTSHFQIMKNIFFAFATLVFLSVSGLAKSQVTVHKMITAGYVYQNQSFGEIGGKLLFLKSDDVAFRLGASALMGSANSRFAIMPKVSADFMLNFEKNVDFYHSYYFVAGVEGTSKYIAPKVGFTLFGLLDVTGGYAFPIADARLNGKELKGLNINFTLNVPTTFIHDIFK